MNTLIPANSSLYLVFGCSINSAGRSYVEALTLKQTTHYGVQPFVVTRVFR